MLGLCSTRTVTPLLRYSGAAVLATRNLANVRTGVPKGTVKRNRPLSYEEANKPAYIGVRKSWNSWNTSGLYIEEAELSRSQPRSAETAFEDIFMRQFVKGTWHDLFVSEVIIKRRHNIIIIAGLVKRTVPAHKIYFLTGYTEELLSHLLKCPVKVEIQTVSSSSDAVFKYI